jgi:hypothetical protein
MSRPGALFGSHFRRRGARRGFSIFFLVILLPGLFLGSALAVDTSRVILARHIASTVADNVAMSAATGILDDAVTLDTRPGGLVEDRAFETYIMASRAGMMPENLNGTVSITELRPDLVTVMVGFTVDDLLLFGFFGQERSLKGGVSRSAGPCLSGSNAESCAYLA